MGLSASAARPLEMAVEPVPVSVLTRRMKSGDEEAYRRFYELYFSRLLRYLLAMTGGQEDLAREALQTTLFRTVRYVKHFEAEDAFWSWLTVLARSALIDEHRKKKRYRGLLERFFHPAPAPPPLPNDGPEVLLELLEENLQTLRPEDRQIVERKYFAKESVLSIAAALNLSEKAIESRLVRIRRHLKEKILKGLEHEK